MLENVKGTKSGFKSIDGGTGDYSSVWTVPRDWDNRTSLITDPPDGRLPPMTPEAEEKQAAIRSLRRPAGWPGRPSVERTLHYVWLASNGGWIPELPSDCSDPQHCGHGDGNDSRFSRNSPGWGSAPAFEHPDLDGRRTRALGRRHAGGRFHQLQAWRVQGLSTEKLHVVERFTRTGPDTLQWEITIDDPGAWTKPWTAKIPLRFAKKAIYEYACHEGNYGLADILAGARREDAAAEAIHPK